ncbi:MAG: hypothetical protein K2J14_05625, partial [Treponemataceae bacterium]|nr:hypothetical protein [Treponemataceae bacterium]
EKIIADIIKNLDSHTKRHAFRNCFNVLDNESYKEGLGQARNGNSHLTQKYNDKKTDLVKRWLENDVCNSYTNLGADYDNNNFQYVTDLSDMLLEEAAGNMQSKTATANVETADLKKVINIAMTASSLGAMHDRTVVAIDHERGCARDLNIDYAMQQSIQEMRDYEQNLGLVR